MLSQVEKTLFRRLSVFMGGFTLGAAQNICSDEPLSTDLVADALSQLVRKSLINADHMGTSDSVSLPRTNQDVCLGTVYGRAVNWKARWAVSLNGSRKRRPFSKLGQPTAHAG